jgi:hypothetical protein
VGVGGEEGGERRSFRHPSFHLVFSVSSSLLGSLSASACWRRTLPRACSHAYRTSARRLHASPSKTRACSCFSGLVGLAAAQVAPTTPLPKNRACSGFQTTQPTGDFARRSNHPFALPQVADRTIPERNL